VAVRNGGAPVSRRFPWRHPGMKGLSRARGNKNPLRRKKKEKEKELAFTIWKKPGNQAAVVQYLYRD